MRPLPIARHGLLNICYNSGQFLFNNACENFKRSCINKLLICKQGITPGSYIPHPQSAPHQHSIHFEKVKFFNIFLSAAAD